MEPSEQVSYSDWRSPAWWAFGGGPCGHCDDCRHAKPIKYCETRIVCSSPLCPALGAKIHVPCMWTCIWWRPRPWYVRLLLRLRARLRHAI